MSRHERTILRIMRMLKVGMVVVVPLVILGVWALLGWVLGRTS